MATIDDGGSRDGGCGYTNANSPQKFETSAPEESAPTGRETDNPRLVNRRAHAHRTEHLQEKEEGGRNEGEGEQEGGTHTKHAPKGADTLVSQREHERAKNGPERREKAKVEARPDESAGGRAWNSVQNQASEAASEFHNNGEGDSSETELDPDEWSWDSDKLLQHCSKPTREKIIRYHEDFESDPRVRRFIWAVAFNPWPDEETGRPVVPWQMLRWVVQEPFTADGGDWWNGGRVLQYLKAETTLGPSGPGPSLSWSDYEREERCRTIETIGLHPDAKRAIKEDLSTPVDEAPEQVYIMTGEVLNKSHGEVTRRRWEKKLVDEVENAPSETAARVLRHMNGRPPRTLSKSKKHISEACERVKERGESERELDPAVRLNYQGRAGGVEYIRGYAQKRFHLSVLRSIAAQHKPFYRFSPKGRTDRIFPANYSALLLPSDVRDVLFQDYYNIDLKSAHLMIAAWLWNAQRTKEKLRDEDYSVWGDLTDHFAPLIKEATGRPSPNRRIQADLKKALKQALYSVVFGMYGANVKGNVTTDMKKILGEEVGSKAGAHFSKHPVIQDLLSARERKLGKIELNGGMATANDGRWVQLESRVSIAKNEGRSNPRRAGAAKVMGTVAQSYEMELMSTLVDYEQERDENSDSNRFRVALWLHDGAYISARSIGARVRDLNERLERKANQLGVHARFEYESVTPPTQ